jgi:hypothetical protein
MTTEATHSGADTLSNAANAIESLLDAPTAPSDDTRKKQTGETETSTQSSDQGETEHKADTEEAPEHSEGETSEADAENQVELPQSIEQLAESMGVDVTTLLSMKARAKIDGQESEVALADLLKSYQLEGHLNKKSMALSEQKKAFEDQARQAHEAINQQMQNANGLLQYVQQELYRDFQAVNWDELRQVDPAEYAAKMQDFKNRESQLNIYQQNIAAHSQKLMHEQQSKQGELYKQVLQHETDALLNALPEWRDTEKGKQERQQLRDYLTNTGYTQQELSQVLDHRSIVVARKAMLYDALMKSKPAVEKKVTNLPKYVKPGAVKSKGDLRSEKNQAAINQLKKSGSVHDAASALMNLL